MKTQLLTLSAVALTSMLVAQTSMAETVHTKTYIDTADTVENLKIDFSAFDVNGDGLYAKSEVGEKLFYVFDQDGNEVIDNLEWDRKSMYTITPMEKETFKFVDYNDDGYTDLSTYTYDIFYKESGLIRFDNDKNGLSASEFIEVGFQELDDNDNNTIELDEWVEAYTAMTRPETAEQERYN
jgi:hypothetical protein